MERNFERRPFKPGDVIVHFKREMMGGGTLRYLYRFNGFVIHSEDKSEYASYTALYDSADGSVHIGDTFIRPADMFLSPVDDKKYPCVKQKYRFEHFMYSEGMALEDVMAHSCARSLADVVLSINLHGFY